MPSLRSIEGQGRAPSILCWLSLQWRVGVSPFASITLFLAGPLGGQHQCSGGWLSRQLEAVEEECPATTAEIDATAKEVLLSFLLSMITVAIR